MRGLPERLTRIEFTTHCVHAFSHARRPRAPDEPRRSILMRSLAHDAHEITDHDLSILLTGEWRARLTAAWLIALDRRTQFRDQLGQMLSKAVVEKAAAGYSVALARFGTPADAELLADALRPDLLNEQSLVVGALLHLDADHAQLPLTLDASGRAPSLGDLERFKGYVGQLCAFADECMNDSPG
ncbi:DUF6000 family protein [Nonomuraea sp. NPDC050556]|uniref:DUF6000 family protein n=1 Tax=Nonomuraea sp. NPDC050556 TaxID=3364369 RepID=UPI00378AEE15